MKTLFRTLTAVGGAALFLASTGAAAAPAAPATSVTVPEEGTLVADGAGVSLSVTFKCRAGWSAGVSAQAAQAVQDDRLATGGSFPSDVDCVGGEQTTQITVMGAGDFAFTDGEALVGLSLYSCNAAGDSCENVDAGGVVPFVKASDD
jgi:hypothetical protein